MLDEPAMAKGHGFFSVGDRDVSQNNRLLAYALDTVGRRQYTIKVKDLATGKTLPDDVAERRAEPGLGRRQPHIVLCREGPGDPAQHAREGSTCSAPARDRQAGL